MTKSSSAQIKPGQSPGSARSFTRLLERQHTLGPHICVQREAVDQNVQPAAAPLVRNVLNSPGSPVDADTRRLMEPRLGHDFSNVRVHTDSQAAESAQAVRAQAYTAGTHVVFGAGKYEPHSQEGQRILGHELTHVVQQSAGPVAGREFAPGFFVSDPADPFERKAAAQAPVEGSAQRLPSTGQATGTTHVQRQTTPAQPDAGLANWGAGFGIAGGIAGMFSGVMAAVAYWHPPDALNPAPVTGGLTINPNPFSFNTVQQTPAMPQVSPIKEPPSHRAQFLQAQHGAPTIHPILELRTDAKNHVLLNLVERHDGLNIVDASIRTGKMEGYLGGSRGSSGAINFSAFQTPPAGSDLFSAEEPAVAAPPPAKAAAPAKGGASAKGGAPAKAAAPPPAPVAAPEPGEVTVSYTGTNAKDQKAPQNFAGSFTLMADGTVHVDEPELTNGIGSANKEGEMGVVDYRSDQGPTWHPGEKGDFPGPEPPGQPKPNKAVA